MTTTPESYINYIIVWTSHWNLTCNVINALHHSPNVNSQPPALRSDVTHLSPPTYRHLPSPPPTYDNERSHVFVVIVVETVEDDEDHAGETEDGGGGHQEQDQLP